MTDREAQDENLRAVKKCPGKRNRSQEESGLYSTATNDVIIYTQRKGEICSDLEYFCVSLAIVRFYSAFL